MRGFLVLLLLSVFTHIAFAQIYKDSSLNARERVIDLLEKMTLEEKVGQLLCPLGWEMYKKNTVDAAYSTKFKEYVREQNIGMLWATFRADPWTKKTLETGLNPELAAKTANSLQKYAIENTRLGIPIFLAEEMPHGHMAIGTTVFPTGIGLASTWNCSLLEQIGSVIAKEIRAQGAHIGYGPVLDLARDPRWSRVEETFGEDPVLSASLGAAMVRGAANNLDSRFRIISTLKHFLAYGVPEGGHNGNISVIGPRNIHENFLPPFKAAIDAGALSVMTSYNSIDGIPCTANKYLLSDVLRDQWGFRGFVVSDLGSIEGLNRNHFVAETLEEAAVLATHAGVDADLGGEAYPYLLNAVQSGRLQEAVVDSAVSRILRLKFEMGLFENPYVDPSVAKQLVRDSTHITIARDAARQSIVLLKNNGVLPINPLIKRIAVVGPNADNIYNMLGDYTAPQDPDNIVTVLEGVKSRFYNSRVTYVKGCDIRDTVNTSIKNAVKIANDSDLIIAVVGGSSARDFKTKYIETGAAIASDESVSDMESGEGYDRATLDLMGKQLDLLKSLKATGKPLIVLYIQGRPYNMNWAAENADALLTAWYPGQQGGNAIADVLSGDYNPAGRLAISIPRHEGQLPVYYNKMNPKGHDYVDMPATPLFSFGCGMSYTQFEYKDLNIDQNGPYEFDVSFSLKNTGAKDGDEVAQLYLKDEFASTVQPVQQLKNFQRVNLKKGEEKKIVFHLDENDLSFLNQEMQWVVEPGAFTIMIGGSSDNPRLTKQIRVE